MFLTKPWGGCYVATVKPFRVALVEPVAYLKSQLFRVFGLQTDEVFRLVNFRLHFTARTSA